MIEAFNNRDVDGFLALSATVGASMTGAWDCEHFMRASNEMPPCVHFSR
jgi:hypothetical protein